MQGWRPCVAAGILATASGAAPLGPQDISVDGWRLSIASLGQNVELAPLSRVAATHEAELPAGVPGWRGPLLLPGPAWVYAALCVDTLKATLANDPKTALELGKDFVLDPAWAAVAAAPGGAHPPGARVRFAYEYALSRIDLVERTSDGRLVVVQGAEHKSQPRLPQGTPGNVPLVAVYLPNSATSLASAHVLRIDPEYDGVPPIARADRLAPLKAKLAGDAPATIVFLGDSITAQPPRDFRDGQGSFVDRFTVWLREAYPARSVVSTRRSERVEPRPGQTVVVMSGVGGDDSGRGLARLDAEALAHAPDLVVAMFGVNDENRAAAGGNAVPVERYRANLAEMLRRVRAAGGELLLMTPSMKNPDWSVTSGTMAEYAQAMRDLAEEAGSPLVDAYRAWELLPARGYHPMVFLGNCINHPVDLGHDLFFRGLRAAFGGDVAAAVPPAAAEAPASPDASVPALCACQPDAPVGRVGDVTVREGSEVQDCRIEESLLHSVAMRRDIRVSVLLPPAYAREPDRAFPVLYALHGRAAPYATWLEMAPLRKALTDAPMIVVSFDGDKESWYLDAPGRPYSQFTTFFFDELASWVEGAYRVTPGQRAATGFSMGANGAFHYLMTRPEFFVSVSGLSSSFEYFGERGRPQRPFVEHLLGPFDQYPERYAALNLRTRFGDAARRHVALPPLFLGCGTEDRGLESCRSFRDYLVELGHAPVYREDPGGHAWPYWRDASVHVVDFHWRAFLDGPPVGGARSVATAPAGK